MERAESQGHRLSSYASSSSTKHSPKTPKKSVEKLSTHSNSVKDESLSPHHLLSGYSYTSINSQSKEQQHPECMLRCTCNNFSYNSLKSAKSNSGSNTGDKFIKLTKSRCDAATSPGRFSQQKSPQTGGRWVDQKNTTGTTCNELRVSDDKKITNKPSPSPRRLVATRNAATSPNLDIRKLGPKQYFEALPKSPDISVKTVLEKSNSLGESKPNRQLRTTRSLSPRPPVRHQHAIMVSDENDVVSVKVSPNDDFEVDMEMKNTTEQISGLYKTLPKHKAQSEQTSPNLGDFDASFSYEKMNNKSTGCLVYVPSDPWLKMSDLDGLKKKSGDCFRKKFARLSDETRSLSRGNIVLDNNDPWIWRKSSNGNSSPKNNMKRSSKQELYRQTKSFSATKFEISNSKQTISLALNDNDIPIKSSTGNRPKLQRCKSPIVIDDDFGSQSLQTPKDLKRSCIWNDSNIDTSIDVSSQQNLSSSRKDLNVTEKSQNNLTLQQNKAFLHVINPNLVQSRHSFSSVSQSKDDELQLNIRRLSEQIKNTSNSSSNNNSNTNQASGADFTDYLNQFKLNEAKKSKTKNSTKNNTDPVLETTC